MVQANTEKKISKVDYCKVLTNKKKVPIHITFHNPNSLETTKKYLTKVVAQRLLEVLLTDHEKQLSHTGDTTETSVGSEKATERRLPNEGSSLL